MRVVIVGAGATGLKAACRIRRGDENAEIIVVEKEKEFSISRCSLPYYIAGLVKRDDLFKTAYGIPKDKRYFRSKNIEVITEAAAEVIDREKKTIEINRNNFYEKIDYDYLIISTGAKPAIPKIDGVNAKGVYCLHSPKDADNIIKRLKKSEKVVIVGAGLIGLECCEAFYEYDVDVTVVEIMNRVLPTLLDYEMAKLVEKHLKEFGITVMTNSKVERIFQENDEVCGVKVNGKEIQCQMVLLATGFRPNVELARESGLEIGKTGAIKVNEFMQTSDSNIYAGGDCVECKCLITGEQVYIPSGSVANRHGRVIADNILGIKRKFKGVLRSIVVRVFDLTVGGIGINEELSGKKGYEYVTAIASFSSDKSHTFPERNPMTLKLVVRKDGKLLGAQVVGKGRCDKKLDSFAATIFASMNFTDLMNIDFAYSPPYSPAVDHVNTMGYIIDNKIRGLLKTIRPDELKSKLERREDIVLVDLRTRREVEVDKISASNYINIPFEEFRNKLKELNIPKNKEIVLICSTGYRSYEALRILEERGYKNVKSLEGGTLLFKAFQ